MSRSLARTVRFSRGARSVLRPFRKIGVRVGRLKGLKFLWLEITRSCNLACKHCYCRSGPNVPVTERMEFGDWCRVMDEARSIGCRRLQFIGGEPTLHPDLLGLIEHAKHAGFKYFEVFTNATLLGEDVIESFKKLGVRVALSLYSSDRETHDQITGHDGSFEKTVDAIERLVEQKIPFRAGVILMEQNATHFKKTKKFLKHLGASYIGMDHVRGIGRGESPKPNARPMDELCGHCWSGKLCIDPNGNAYPCVFSRFAPVGNFLTDGIKGIVEGQKLHCFSAGSLPGRTRRIGKCYLFVSQWNQL